MLRRLIQLICGKKQPINPVASEFVLLAAQKTLERVNGRPAPYNIIDALCQNRMIVAKRQLRAWWIGLNRERLPSGDCWVIGGYFFCFDFQWSLALTIEDAVANLTNPRIFVGRAAFWSVACLELWEAGRVDELRRRLPGVLQIYNPQVYVTWARVLVIEGRALEAGRYFLFSGLYDDSEIQFVARFKSTFAHSHPNEIVGRMPGPCTKKSARRQFPPRVYEDLATLPCPEWLKRRPAQQTWESC
jgi:hypothetical protein